MRATPETLEAVWRDRHPPLLPRAIAKDGMVAFVSHRRDGNLHSDRIAIIQRAVAAWNACAGIEAEDLEADPSVNLLSLHVDRADKAQARADDAEALLVELLSVAQGLHVSLRVPQIYPGDEVRLTDQLEQAGKVIRQTYAFVGKEFPG